MAVNFPHGVPYWVDVSSPDLKQTCEFYEQLFNWETTDLGKAANHYTLFLRDGKQVAAAAPLMNSTDEPAWSVFMKVDDPHAIASSVQSYGGTVTVPPMEVMDQTMVASFMDPAGVPFSVAKPMKHKGAQRWAEPGSVCWVQIAVPQMQPSLGFFQQIFGWQADTSQFGDSYTVLSPPKGDPMSAFGGMYETPDEPPKMSVVFAVEDCHDTAAMATKLGATVTSDPEEMESVGVTAEIADPMGTKFSILEPKPGPM